MRKFFNHRLTRSAATAALSLGLGLGMAAKGFAETRVSFDRVAVTDPQQAGSLTITDLESMLRAADHRVNVITISGQTHFEYYVPAHNGHPDRHIVIGISPNHRYVNLFCALGKLTDQGGPTRGQLAVMLKRNFDNMPCCFGLEDDVIRLDVCLRNVGITTGELKARIEQLRKGLEDADELLVRN